VFKKNSRKKNLLIVSEVELLRGPKACLVFFVHVPEARVLNRKHDESIRVLNKQRFREKAAAKFQALELGNERLRDTQRGAENGER